MRKLYKNSGGFIVANQLFNIVIFMSFFASINICEFGRSPENF